MPELSKEACKRRDELIDATWQPGEPWHVAAARAFALYIDEVGRVAREIKRWRAQQGPDNLEEIIAPLMLPDPPDPLRDALANAIENSRNHDKLHEMLRAELAKRGLEVRKSGLRLRKHFSWSGTLS